MKLLLIAGQFHHVLQAYLREQGLEVINGKPLLLEDALGYVLQSNVDVQGVLLTDAGLGPPGPHVQELLKQLVTCLKQNYHNSQLPILLLTREGSLADSLKAPGSVQVLEFSQLRLPLSAYQQACQQVLSKQAKAPDSTPKRSFSFFERFRQKQSEPQAELAPTDQLAKEMGAISKSISRVIVVTGHRGAGLTSTAANTAITAQLRGLSTILVDMDVDYRGTNMYFGAFNTVAQQDEELRGSLIRCLAKPQGFSTSAFNVKDKLWLTTLAYSFNDRHLLEQFYTCNKFINMISVLRQKFNTVVIDLPLDLLTNFQAALIHVDVFGLCVPNNLHAILSTLRNAQVRLEADSLNYLNAKAKIIVTKYNPQASFQGELFTPEAVCQILSSDLSDSFKLPMPLAGYISYSPEFDGQIETDIPIATQSEMFEKAYAQTLLRLMEGVK